MFKSCSKRKIFFCAFQPLLPPGYSFSLNDECNSGGVIGGKWCGFWGEFWLAQNEIVIMKGAFIMKTCNNIVTKNESNGLYGSSNKIVTIVAYLLGMSNQVLREYYDAEVLQRLEQFPPAGIVRALCMIRMVFMTNFLNIDNDLKNIINIDKQACFDQNLLRKLISDGVMTIQCNCNADNYIAYVTRLIDYYINLCSELFPYSIKFSYIRRLFVPKGYEKPGTRQSEFMRYHANKNYYPYQLYMVWKPEECGNILLNDSKFLRKLYEQNKENFMDVDLYKDVSDDVKQKINDFINRTVKMAVVVDCENVDPYKLYGMLSGLPVMTRQSISQIVLYNDANASAAWNYLKYCIDIPVVCHNTQRILERKSVVDIEMAMGTMRMCHEQGVDSIILCSSDSDFCPLIQALPNVNFMVLYEHRKCSSVTQNVWQKDKALSFALDDFYLADSATFQRKVVLETIKKTLPFYVGTGIDDFVASVLKTAGIPATKALVQELKSKYVAKARFDVSATGEISIAI